MRNKPAVQKAPRILMVSSSGGHFEELRMLKPLETDYHLVWVTERTDYNSPADHFLMQTGLRDWAFPFKMAINTLHSLLIWLKEKPEAVITTGTMVALPLCLFAKLLRKKVVFIESFARIYDGTRTGKFMYKIADLFIYQWETLEHLYPKGVFGGSIF